MCIRDSVCTDESTQCFGITKCFFRITQKNYRIFYAVEVSLVPVHIIVSFFDLSLIHISNMNFPEMFLYFLILELLKKGIQSDDFGKYSKDAYIHNLIYPMRRTSDEIEYQAHNLWLIDERLAY